MKRPDNKCDEPLIELFFDGELGPSQHDRIRKHVAGCPACRKQLEENRVVSDLFKTSLDREVARSGLGGLEEKLVGIVRQRNALWWRRFVQPLVPVRLVIPAAVAGLLILFLTFQRGPLAPSDPSALVESFSGEVSSVMIIEAPKSRQTIIWYKETS